MIRDDLRLLRGAIDLHTHSTPDLIARSIDDIELAKQAARAGMRGIVLKSHFSMTQFRADLVKKVVDGLEVFGGVVLNHYVGGLNPHAVDVVLKGGGKIVWMPTKSAKNHLAHMGADHVERTTRGALLPVEGISPIDRRGAISPEVEEILNLIAEANAILATGHLSVEESKVLVKEARNVGVKKILINHPEFIVVDMSVDDQIEMAKAGAYLEHTWPAVDYGRIVETIRATGVDHSVIATDLGQITNPVPTEGFRVYIQRLLRAGIRPSEIEVMVKRNPETLLDLPGSLS